MSSSIANSAWNYLSPLIVDRIVKTIKQNRVWRNECQTLRTLNKHWCDCLNYHITRAQPGDNRRITPADVQSLLKFPNLESIEIFPFVFLDSKDQSLISREYCWHKFNIFELEPRLMEVLKVTTKVPKLTELVLDQNLALVDRTIWMKDEVQALLRSLKVTSIKVCSRHLPITLSGRTSGPSTIRFVLLNFSGPGYLDIYPFSAKVCKLDLKGGHQTCTPELYSQIMSFGKSCKKRLSFIDCDRHLDPISEIENIETLDLGFHHVEDLSALHKMTTLKHLGLTLATESSSLLDLNNGGMKSRMLHELCLLSNTLQLESVTIFFDWEFFEGDQDAIHGLQTVKCIEIVNAELKFYKIIRSLPKLEFLSILYCDSRHYSHRPETAAIYSYMGRLDTVEGRVLYSLKGLRIDYRTASGKTTIASVCKLQNLRALGLSGEKIGRFQDLNQLTSLKNLRHLELSFNKSYKWLLDSPCPKILNQLDSLHLWTRCSDPSSKLAAAVEVIEKEAPNLKIRIQLLDFYDLYRQFGSGSS